MLDRAKALLRQIMEALGPEAAEGTPIVGLEPACVATFRDELTNLFPNDDRAQRLAKQTVILSEFLAREGVELPELRGKATVHLHCNHHAILRREDETRLLAGMGLDLEVLDSGCCGMAGPFGFEKEHFDVSIKCGERVLLPAVRAAGEHDLIVADGFSCREQIAQGTDRQTLHFAEVVRMAMRRSGAGSAGKRSGPADPSASGRMAQAYTYVSHAGTSGLMPT
jgi:Fe-S oxidoreductase